MSFIKKIRIKNFKNLEDVEIDIKPLTFLFGPNGSGKSSFIKALMFLSKNLFPINTGKTIYKLSEEVDLGSFKEIVNNNDISKTILFEFEISGKYEFPKFEVLQPEKIENELISEYLDKLKNESFFSVLEHALRDLKSIGHETESILNEENFEFIFRVELRHFENACNIDSFTLEDKTNHSSLKYFCKPKVWKSRESDMEKESQRRMVFNINFCNNLFLTELFEYIVPLQGFYEPQFYGDTMPDDPFIGRDVSFPQLPGISAILKNDFNLRKEFLEKEKVIYPEWSKFSESKKLKFFYEVIKFIYLIYRMAPHTILHFLNIFHLPTVRQIPERRYFLINGKFDETDYYGILNFLGLGQKEFIRENSSFDLIYDFSKLEDKIKKYENRKTNSYSFLLGNQHQLVYLLTNYYLLRFDFNSFLRIHENEEIGQIVLHGYGKENVNLTNASSGLIQVLPIIICCSINRTEIFGDSYGSFESQVFTFNPSSNCSYFLDNEYRLYFNTLLIEQPELHLHPKLQSKLAELFSGTINTKNNLFIETHSEHLIRKIQILIAKGELDREKIGVWYFESSTEEKIIVKQMEIEENGFFKEPWPNGFFDDSANLSWELLTANKN